MVSKTVGVLAVVLLVVVVSGAAFFIFSKNSNDNIYGLNTDIQMTSENSSKVIGNFYKQSNEPYSEKVTVFFVGTGYCTFCAAERWPLVESLGKFGSFEGLKESTTSDIGGEYSSLPTYTFVGINYNSSYVDFIHKETYDKEYNQLESVNFEEKKIIDKYNPFGGIPFLMIAGKRGVYTQVSSGYSPGVLSGLTFSQVVEDLKNNPDSKEVASIRKESGMITAIVCYNNDNEPANVCDNPEIKSLVEKLV